MSLSQAFAAAVPAQHRATDPPNRLDVSDGDLHFAAAVVEADRLACSLLDAAWSLDGAAPADAQALRDLGDATARRLCYLLEPLAPVELDADRCVLQMRSTQPAATQQGKEYYELVIAGDRGATLHRYVVASGQGRQPAPMAFTRDVAARLVGDVAELLAQG